MLKPKYVFVVFCSALFLSGCETIVLRQDIPVSTNPMGARIFANGQYVGQTPATVSLERTKNHILTLVKENYRQEDVVISRQYQSDKVLMNAVLTGVNSGLFFKDKRMGVSSGMGSISRQEATGEAYILVPPAVKVSLIPLDGSSALAPDAGGYPASPSAVDSRSSSVNTGFTADDALKAGIVAGVVAGTAQAKPIEKKWETSSTSKSYVKSDGTVVTKKSSTSVGVSVNPSGLVQALDILFK
jgi:hypothetical protein